MKNNEDKSKGAIMTDPKGIALARITKALHPLSQRAKRRVLMYASDLLAEATEQVPLKVEASVR